MNLSDQEVCVKCKKRPVYKYKRKKGKLCATCILENLKKFVGLT